VHIRESDFKVDWINLFSYSALSADCESLAEADYKGFEAAI